MRTRLIEDDKLECVLGLGPNLFYNSSMTACIVICRMNKPPERKGKVLFIDAVHEIVRERTQSYLTDKHIQKILHAYHAFQDIEGFARVVSKDEILANQANLNIPLYVRSIGNGSKVDASEEMSLTHAITEWQESSLTMRASMSELFSMLEEAGFDNKYV